MKIHEILNEDQFEPQIRSLPISTPGNIEKVSNFAKKHEFDDNSGAYAMGIEDPTDPHMYRKKMKAFTNLDQDAYFQYIKYITPYMDSNHCFPKVYVTKIKEYSNGYKKPSYQMEKLITLNEAEDIFGAGKLSDFFFKRYFNAGDHSDLAIDHMGSYIAVIKRAIYGAFDTDDWDNDLAQAVKLIQQFLADFKDFTLDLHRGNLMVRMTSTGPQLVLTDPVQDEGKSIVGYNTFKGR